MITKENGTLIISLPKEKQATLLIYSKVILEKQNSFRYVEFERMVTLILEIRILFQEKELPLLLLQMENR